MYKAYIYW